MRLAGAPALLRYRGPPEAAAGHGTVLFYHGFGGTEERPEAYLTALAEAGCLAVSVDAVGHGERRLPDFEVIFDDERWDAQFEEVETHFLQVLDDTAAEVPAIIDDLMARGLARADRVGVAGRSLVRQHRVRVGAGRRPGAGGRLGGGLAGVDAAAAAQPASPPGPLLPRRRPVAGGGVRRALPAR